MVNASSVRKWGTLGRMVLEHAGKSRGWGALVQAGRVTLTSVARVMHILWLEVTGFIFLGIASLAGFAVYREYAEYQAGKFGPGRVIVTAAVALVFGWFGLTSFWRARKR